MEKSHKSNTNHANIELAIQQSWQKLAPMWPLDNLIAANYLAGFEDLSFTDALKQGQIYLQTAYKIFEIKTINTITIKWLQVFFDEGQAAITMPMRKNGFLNAMLNLLIHDKKICSKNHKLYFWLKNLPHNNTAIIDNCLNLLQIQNKDFAEFIFLILTTLPGWAMYIKYCTDIRPNTNISYQITQNDYIAFRLIITCFIWPQARMLLQYHAENKKKCNVDNYIQSIQNTEQTYRQQLITKLKLKLQNTNNTSTNKEIFAQIICCIDTRSELLRRQLERCGKYKTFSMAGFFGIPLYVKDQITEKSYSSFPFLIKNFHNLQDKLINFRNLQVSGFEQLTLHKKIYNSLKYAFISSFVLAEAWGIISGLLMILRCIFPGYLRKLTNDQKILLDKKFTDKILNIIPLDKQIYYAHNALQSIGLIKNFSPLVVICGHGSTNTNNPFSGLLDCGACGGRQGALNASILAIILNNTLVRDALNEKSINIPQETIFIAAQHNTTTQELQFFYTDKDNKNTQQKINTIQNDWQQINTCNDENLVKAVDWAETRPEWGLAKNAAFIIGPRHITEDINLSGQVFLHSYEPFQDENNKILSSILTAPLRVAQWINNQYLLASIDNITYGGGSKVTTNITGKIGIMQGNSSDLMNSLPLQSLYQNDKIAYHQPQRLFAVIFASRQAIDYVIQQEKKLHNLLCNQWIQVMCIEPESKDFYLLHHNLEWKKLN